ncbi:MAG: BON domain-containing protein [Magnetococcales bacterium]|nr:BON domain-containing protein [Magnetococcales bacterium]
MKKTMQINLLCGLTLSCLAGCIPVVVGGGMAATTGVVGEDRTVSNQMEDSWVAMKIRSRFVQSDLVRVGNIGVSVNNGKVLLTGAAMNQEEVDEAIRIAREARGVTEVRSEIRVQYVGPSELANDALITSKVKSQFLVNSDIHGLNIHVKTTKGVVYLTGESKTTQERDRAIQVARQVSDVREVVSYIDIIPESSGKTSGATRELAPVTSSEGAVKVPSTGHDVAPVSIPVESPKVSGAVHETVSPVAAPGTSAP